MKKKAVRNKIDKYVRWWVKWTGLGWWHIDVRYDYKDEKKIYGDGTLALCTANWQYMDATVSFNMKGMKELSDEEIEKTVLHELSHILVCEMREGGVEHEERVVTTLQRAFIWIRERTKEETK